MATTATNKSALAQARDVWFDSDEGILALGTSILWRTSYLQFLRNRLELAFIAGAKAQEQIEKEA